jgi:hypothetical protein
LDTLAASSSVLTSLLTLSHSRVQGFLVPQSNPAYWNGLQADGWPTFKWSDVMVPSPNEKGGYANWGTFYNPNNPEAMYVPEPNNMKPPEQCAVGNYTQGTGKPFTWAWADSNCYNTFVSICRINRELLMFISVLQLCSCCHEWSPKLGTGRAFATRVMFCKAVLTCVICAAWLFVLAI